MQFSILDTIIENPLYGRKIARFLSRNQATYDPAVMRNIRKWRELTCRLANNQPTKKGGYIQTCYNQPLISLLKSLSLPTRDSGTKSTVIHKVVLTAYKGPATVGNEASHLCNNAKCVNYRHLTWESPQVNQSRKNCKRWRVDNDKLYDVCPHEPPCIDTTFMKLENYREKYKKRVKLNLIN